MAAWTALTVAVRATHFQDKPYHFLDSPVLPESPSHVPVGAVCPETLRLGRPDGVRVAAKEMKAYEARLQRSANLPKYDILIKPRINESHVKLFLPPA